MMKERSISILGKSPTKTVGIVSPNKKKKKKTLSYEVLILCKEVQYDDIAFSTQKK